MALTAREQQMIDLHDRGLSHSQIAREMRIKTKSVQRVLKLLDAGPQDDQRHRRATAAGSAELLARLRKAGGHR
jgi:DNA-binding NarL/FixJ family response regulator